VIVGSHEERISISSYDNVFLYPLIERKFMNLPRKVHSNGEFYNICFHGNYPHLFKFSPHLRDAIEDINKIKKVKLHIITGPLSKEYWHRDIGKPNVEVHFHNYSDISKVISSCDVGVVPNVSDILYMSPDFKKQTSPDLGMYETDYFLRFKNKTNPGRAYVFYQHGIPVIHDLSPSSFEMMSLTNVYDVAHNKNSWSRSLKKYMCNDHRQRVSEKFREVFEDKYDPITWAKILYDDIERLKNE
jgi:hypothetical protein